ncbi:hypothetical protein SEA_NYCEIRAE_45 [Gordonia phage Nyceirae]|uniref:Uncharacterized protein n=1 Tax=Gordonia phage Nyceirae TaxID=1887651 RepID=A0A1C9EI00_9CAUD|nr:hypothetical protein BIZ68_gp45 [Gordonia phage Nyceirae]AON97408.1 hypothetical protein SEA_NYCEIRAE_45 [Gordonia phage Nyceirae]
MSRTRPPRTCRYCRLPVLWWRNANRDGSICVDVSADDNGTVQKVVTHPAGERPVVWGRRLTGLDLATAVEAGEQLFTLHATTCSARKQRNPKPEGLQIAWPNHNPRR